LEIIFGQVILMAYNFANNLSVPQGGLRALLGCPFSNGLFCRTIFGFWGSPHTHTHTYVHGKLAHKTKMRIHADDKFDKQILSFGRKLFVILNGVLGTSKACQANGLNSFWEIVFDKAQADGRKSRESTASWFVLWCKLMEIFGLFVIIMRK
jgi:hypothetical protein